MKNFFVKKQKGRVLPFWWFLLAMALAVFLGTAVLNNQQVNNLNPPGAVFAEKITNADILNVIEDGGNYVVVVSVDGIQHPFFFIIKGPKTGGEIKNIIKESLGKEGIEVTVGDSGKLLPTGETVSKPEDLSNSVARMKSSEGVGTGFVIAQEEKVDYIVTNAHGVPSVGYIGKLDTFAPRRSISYRVVARDIGRDLALVVVYHNPDFKKINISLQLPKTGQSVLMYGCFMGNPPTFPHGTFGQDQVSCKFVNTKIRLTQDMIEQGDPGYGLRIGYCGLTLTGRGKKYKMGPGRSGSPVVDAETMSLVGIVSRTGISDDVGGLIIPSTELIEFLKENNYGYLIK